MKVACVNLRLRVSLYKQWGLLQKLWLYPLIAEKYNESVAYRSYFTNKSFRAVCSLRDLSDICVQ